MRIRRLRDSSRAAWVIIACAVFGLAYLWSSFVFDVMSGKYATRPDVPSVERPVETLPAIVPGDAQ